jgi:hypothetical protein
LKIGDGSYFNIRKKTVKKGKDLARIKSETDENRQKKTPPQRQGVISRQRPDAI